MRTHRKIIGKKLDEDYLNINNSRLYYLVYNFDYNDVDCVNSFICMKILYNIY